MAGIGAILLLLAGLRYGAEGACYKHATCNDCIAEIFVGGTCLWYQPQDRQAHGTCIAGKVGADKQPAVPTSNPADSFSTWNMTLVDGRQAAFTVWDLDTYSPESCYTTTCLLAPQCGIGYYAVKNDPCYGEGVHPDYRILKCCREQRNIDGNLVGFNTWQGTVQGSLFFAACCAPCYPGQVNVGCDSYVQGTCVNCAAGKYNADVTPGSTCLDCPACPAGSTRQGCGPSSVGVCQPCPALYFKVAGVEGQYTDKCQACGTCPQGSVRVGCGADSPGTCQRCNNGTYYASPFCRNCTACKTTSGNLQNRFGCGGSSEGTCTTCQAGSWEPFTGACFDCRACLANQTSGLDFVAGLNMSSPLVRVGCAGKAAGACVRAGAAIVSTSARPCPTFAAPQAYCQGPAFQIRWVLAGLNASQLSTANGGCSTATATGACLAAIWRAELMMRSAAAPDGQKVRSLGEWWAEDLADSGGSWSALPESGSNFLAQAQLPALRDGLPEGAGYFIRISMTDNGGSCCAATGGSPLVAETVEFALADGLLSVEDAIEDSIQWALSDNVGGALAVAAAGCQNYSLGDGSDPDLVTAVCEHAKALKLAQPLGGSTLATVALLQEAASQPDLAVRVASIPVAEARDWLGQAESLGSALASAMPTNLQQWLDLVTPLMLSVNVSDRPAQPLKVLSALASDAVDLAHSLGTVWQSEEAAATRQLGFMLSDLKTLDGLLGDSADAAGYDVVRQAQAVTLSLQQQFAAGPPPGNGTKRDAWFSSAFQSAGNMAFMLLGTWSESWRNNLEWQLAAEVGDMTDFPPAGVSTLDFGGAKLPVDAVSLDKARARVWGPLKTVATNFLNLWSSVARRNLAEVPQEAQLDDPLDEREARRGSSLRRAADGDTNRTNGSNSSVVDLDTVTTPGSAQPQPTASTQALADAVNEILGLVEAVTEGFMAPLMRPGALLSAGPLPPLPGCGGRRRLCISDLATIFSEEQADRDAWLGFGAKAMRPWLPYAEEQARILRGAHEINSFARSRARLLEEVLLRVVDARELQVEAQLIGIANDRAGEARNHLSSISSPTYATGPPAPTAEWHWRDIRSQLVRAQAGIQASAQRLGRRRLFALEQLAIWIANGRHWGASNPWRINFVPGRDNAARLTQAVAAAANELQRALTAAVARTAAVGTAWLRVEVYRDEDPVAFAGLQTYGTGLFSLKHARGWPDLRMHQEARAFLLSAPELVLPLVPVNPKAPVAKDATSTTPFVELTLTRVATGSGAPPKSSATDGQFVTNHARRQCGPLWSAPPPSGQMAAIWPLEDTWALRVRDGPTRTQLVIEDLTTVRLLFKVDVLASQPPWALLDGEPPDVLYDVPQSSDCNALRTVFGQVLNATTTTVFVPNASGDATTTLAPLHTTGRIVPLPYDPNAQGDGNKSNMSQGLVEQELAVKAKGAGGVSSWLQRLPSWFVGLLAVALGCSCCLCTGLCGWCYRRRRQRRRLARIAAAESERKSNEASGNEKGPESPISQRVVQPVSKLEGDSHALRKAGNAEEGDQEEWGTTDTPRNQEKEEVADESSSEGSKSWDEASTPPEGGSPRSSSSEGSRHSQRSTGSKRSRHSKESKRSRQSGESRHSVDKAEAPDAQRSSPPRPDRPRSAASGRGAPSPPSLPAGHSSPESKQSSGRSKQSDHSRRSAQSKPSKHS